MVDGNVLCDGSVSYDLSNMFEVSNRKHKPRILILNPKPNPNRNPKDKKSDIRLKLNIKLYLKVNFLRQGFVLPHARIAPQMICSRDDSPQRRLAPLSYISIYCSLCNI